MEITIKNLGCLEEATFSLGDMTIICGDNNTGKTYATYALFGFLSFWRQAFEIDIDPNILDKLLTDGIVEINILDYLTIANDIIAKSCEQYKTQLSTIFATSKERFINTDFSIQIDTKNIQLKDSYQSRVGSLNVDHFVLTKTPNSNILTVSFILEKGKPKFPQAILHEFISDALKEIIFVSVFPNPFIASAERTGAAIFRKELNFARNRLLEEMSQNDRSINPMDLLFKFYEDYALPIKANVEFIRDLESIFKRQSYIAQNHPELLAEFSDIIGGQYLVTSKDELYFLPKSSRKKVRLSMDESSSAVRSLLDIGFYLKHIAQPGDLFIVDEPELNLHPENQRRIARLFAQLINLGIKVFITTHSDYIIKELNTLIMLKQDKPFISQLRTQEGYKENELLDPQKVKVYVAEKALVKVSGSTRRRSIQTLSSASITPELGIEVKSFDTAIAAINRIQELIVWGE